MLNKKIHNFEGLLEWNKKGINKDRVIDIYFPCICQSVIISGTTYDSAYGSLSTIVPKHRAKE